KRAAAVVPALAGTTVNSRLPLAPWREKEWSKAKPERRPLLVIDGDLSCAAEDDPPGGRQVTWHKAAALTRKWQLNQLAGRLEEMARKTAHPGERSPQM